MRLDLNAIFNDIPNIKKKGYPDIMAKRMQEKVQAVLDEVAKGATLYSEHVLKEEETDKLKAADVQADTAVIDGELIRIVKDKQTFDKSHGTDIKKLVSNCEP